MVSRHANISSRFYCFLLFAFYNALVSCHSLSRGGLSANNVYRSRKVLYLPQASEESSNAAITGTKNEGDSYQQDKKLFTKHAMDDGIELADEFPYPDQSELLEENDTNQINIAAADVVTKIDQKDDGDFSDVTIRIAGSARFNDTEALDAAGLRMKMPAIEESHGKKFGNNRISASRDGKEFDMDSKRRHNIKIKEGKLHNPLATAHATAQAKIQEEKTDTEKVGASGFIKKVEPVELKDGNKSMEDTRNAEQNTSRNEGINILDTNEKSEEAGEIETGKQYQQAGNANINERDNEDLKSAKNEGSKGNAVEEHARIQDKMENNKEQELRNIETSEMYDPKEDRDNFEMENNETDEDYAKVNQSYTDGLTSNNESSFTEFEEDIGEGDNDFIQDFVEIPSMFHDTAETMANTLMPDFQKLSNKSIAYFSRAHQDITEGFQPLLGRKFAMIFGSLLSYVFALLPLFVVVALFDQIRTYVSLQKVILLANAYLAVYFCVSTLAFLIIGTEPLVFFFKNSFSGHVYLRLLEALGYILYLVLQCIDLARNFSKGTNLAKATSFLQFGTSMFIGLHYYVTVFLRVMAQKAPHTSWKTYSAYTGAFGILCLVSHIMAAKKECTQRPQGFRNNKEK